MTELTLYLTPGVPLILLDQAHATRLKVIVQQMLQTHSFLFPDWLRSCNSFLTQTHTFTVVLIIYKHIGE